MNAQTYVTSPTYHAVFSDYGIVSSSFSTFQLALGEHGACFNPGEAITINTLVRMSPQTAKQILRVLAVRLREYEAEYGIIPAVEEKQAGVTVQ